MSQLPCAFCDVPIPQSEAERSSLCPVCSRPLTVCGKYRLTQLLSKSDSDRVYSAKRDGDGEEVAVKILLARDDDWTAISEFERIGRFLQSQKRVGLPEVYGWERGGHGRLILVRERLDGHTLESRLRGGQQPNAGALRKMLEDLLVLLGELHAMTPAVTHRDIRANNILFRKASLWAPVLVDFKPTVPGSIGDDLRALGRMFQALSDHQPTVTRLAEGKFANAAEALASLRVLVPRSSLPPSDPPPPSPFVVPRPPKKRSALWLVVVMVFAMLQVARLAKRHPTPPKKPTSSREVGDSSVENYRAQCDWGDGLGCYNLGYRYEIGFGIAKDESRAATLYQRGCDLGEKLGCNNLGVLFETGRGVAKDPVHAIKLYLKACNQEDWLACRNLGYMYSNAVGVAQDVPRAKALYEKACDHGEVKGCYNLGVLYENGKGVDVDLTSARALYGRACDGKDWEGCTNLGWLYASGKGTATDTARAQTLYQKACDNGDARGCNNLGVIFEKGRDVPLDNDRAFKLYQQACDGDDSYGCTNLGYFYESGKGVSKDMKKATRYYHRSCELGYEKGCQYACDEGDRFGCDEAKRLK